MSAFQWRGVWGERTSPTAGKGYCAHLGHPEDETGLVYMRARYYESDPLAFGEIKDRWLITGFRCVKTIK